MSVELGCGLLALGRQWGTSPGVPSDNEAMHFLRTAYDLGIRFFDTAPAYGLSERRLGAFLATLDDDKRAEVTVATKFGEHWDAATNTGYTDHSFEALRRSLDQSLQYLGGIALLQLHKATPELLQDADVRRAFDYARQRGVLAFGASASDPQTANLALEDELFSFVQLPYNQANVQMQDIVTCTRSKGKQLIINRPFQMGTAMAASTDKQQAAAEAFRFILQEDFDGVILTGTSNINHLRENMAAFRAASEQA